MDESGTFYFSFHGAATLSALHTALAAQRRWPSCWPYAMTLPNGIFELDEEG